MIRSTAWYRMHALNNATSKQASRAAQMQERAMTGLKVAKPSDDPAVMNQIYRAKWHIESQQMYQDNASEAVTFLATTDTVLTEMQSDIARARELAVQYSNEHYGSQERSDGADIIDSLLERMIAAANTKFGDRYIFAGDNYHTEAFDSTGTYQGSTEAPVSVVGETLEVAHGFDGSTMLQGTTDVFAVLSDFSTALSTNTVADVQAAIDTLDDAMDQLIDSRSQVGNEINTAEDAQTLASHLEETLQERVASLQEADMIETYTKLGEIQLAYDAAIQITSKARWTSLFHEI